MVKIHPENIQKGDEMYDLLKSIVCGLFFCLCICVGMILIIIYSVENNIDNSSGSY